MSIAKGARRTVGFALERGCEALQVFSSNPRGWALPKAPGEGDLELRGLLEEHDLHPLLVHAPYLVNIASPDPDVYTRSVGSLVAACERARRLGGDVVVHTGRDASSRREAVLERAAAAVLAALKLVGAVRILLEPTAGGRGTVAATVPETAELLEAIGDERAGVCLDTCHVHAAGYDLADPGIARGFVDEAVAAFGDRLVALHANDSRDPSGSHRDRHWHLGEGTIGPDGFRATLGHPALAGVAVILETPGKAAEDRENLARARAFAGRSPQRLKASARSSKTRRK